MTYKELEKLTKGKTLPICGKNEDGENVIIEHKTERWTYKNESWERKFFKLTTAQNNGCTRHNCIFEDGSTEEFYTK